VQIEAAESLSFASFLRAATSLTGTLQGPYNFLPRCVAECVNLDGSKFKAKSSLWIALVEERQPRGFGHQIRGRSANMSSLTLEEATAAKGIGTNPQPCQAITTKAALEELFELLEEYGPIWYTEEHHNRALSALLGQ
jgi:hypothetical protein